MHYTENVLGIDFGITNSRACIYKEGNAIMIPSAEGESIDEKIFPNYVAFTENGEILIGEPARKQAHINPENTISNIKRQLGTDYKVNLQGKEYVPEEITAMILRKIKKDAETFLGEPINKVVLSVPLYFDYNQRTALKDSAMIAGFQVLSLINEPTAACLAYEIDKQKDDLNILVFDLSRGTLDVTILEFSGGIFEVQATSGNTQLGGYDMNLALKKYLADEFKKEYGIDLLDDEQANMRLEHAVERVTIELTNTVETDVNLPFIAIGNNGRPLNLITTINRSKLKSLVDPIVKKCGETIQRALDDAIMQPEDIDKVILVSEPTRMPIVQNYVKDFLGKEVERGIDPRECISQGAARQGNLIKSIQLDSC